MKNSRPRIKFSQTPHSISRRIETIPNKTAAALLSLINRKTVGFGVGYVDLPYRQISDELAVGPRAIQNAAKLLERWGDIIRERVSGRIYRWRVVLERDEIIEDPRRTYTTKDVPKEQVRIQRSGPCGSNDPDHADPTIRTFLSLVEQANPLKTEEKTTSLEQKTDLLKNSFKERDLKKQQQEELPDQSPDSAKELSTPDDEPLHKICLKGLCKHGVSQRMARKLCREHDHELILSVLETAPKRPGVQNLPAYIVSEIQDGGYEQTSEGQKNGHQVSGGRSNYAHLTPKKINSTRHKTVKAIAPIDAPISYRSVEETKTELQALEEQKLEQEQEYQKKSQELAERFKTLPQALQLRLKLIASVHLSKLVPGSGKREEMLRDKTFRRMANRTVLEKFFKCLDDGLGELEVLQHLEASMLTAA